MVALHYPLSTVHYLLFANGLATRHDGLQLRRLGRRVLSEGDEARRLPGVLREALRRGRAGYDVSCRAARRAHADVGRGDAGGVSVLPKGAEDDHARPGRD